MAEGLVVCFGELLARLSPPGSQRLEQAETLELSFGGAEANVAVSLARFGVPVRFVTRVPDNDLGRAATAALRRWGVTTDTIVASGSRMGLYFLEAGQAQRPSRVLYDRAGSAMAQLHPGMIDWSATLKGSGWLHTSGITPAISKTAAEATLEAVRTARSLGLKVSIDLNYRAALWRWGETPERVMGELVGQADVLLANEEDADKVLGIRPPSADITSGQLAAADYESVCVAIVDRFPNLSTVAITLRGSKSASHNAWSAVAWSTRVGFIEGAAYDIWPIVDRVGAGDAFAAGLIFRLLHDEADLAGALHFAIAASCLKHTIPGDLNIVRGDEVERLMGGDRSGRVQR
ncbi:MAG: sugar kinase [Candidatus Limnocylindria bacterium]